ncbi:MAG: threonylcarbamoyl-AMP synthase, partial [Eubacterium sp.]|nr:threonylcarbamoyl-AMP synthase [Eubacterium sp.]
MNTKVLTTSKEDIKTAGEILKNGGLVAFPTETVYGLGANALDGEAVKSIYTAKGRPGDNPLIVHVAEEKDIIPLVKEVTPKAQALIDAFFPAPLTVILKKSALVPDITSGGLDTVAVRMPQNEVARAVIKASGCPIAAPSANTSGLPSPTKAQHVIDDMTGKIDAILDGGDCEFGVESTVVTLVSDTPVILRPGAVTKEMLEAVIGPVELSPAVLNALGENETAASPGMKYKHYSPRVSVTLVKGSVGRFEQLVKMRNGFALCFEGDEISVPHITYGKEDDGLSQARELFDALRRLDETGAEKVYARAPETSGVGMAVYNRIVRAAAFRIIDLEKPFVIGLTGPTGAGKGYVGEALSALGFRLIDSDKISRELTADNSPLLAELQKEFGEDIVTDGVLNRALLAERAFSDRERTDRLNAIMHPAIAERCKSEADGLSVLDAPQLFEAG